MSKIDVTSCDGCDAMAPPGYCWAYPAHGWIHIDGEATLDPSRLLVGVPGDDRRGEDRCGCRRLSGGPATAA